MPKAPKLPERLTYANVMATIAVFVAMGGASYAATQLPKNSVGTKQLKKNSVTTAKIKKGAVTGAKIKKEAITAAKVKNGTLTGTQINVSKLGTVPTANSADVAGTASSLTPPEPWHEVGAPGEPGFENSWKNFPPTSEASFEHLGFYRDHEGLVHLKGNVFGGTAVGIFHLPAGYRPGRETLHLQQVACLGGTKWCVEEAGESGPLDIIGSLKENPTGSGLVAAPPEAKSVNLNGITYRAES